MVDHAPDNGWKCVTNADARSVCGSWPSCANGYKVYRREKVGPNLCRTFL